MGEDTISYQQQIEQNTVYTNTITSILPKNPKDIIIRESPTHGRGAFVTQPVKKKKLGRYAPDVDPITTAEADSLPQDRQDYLVKIFQNNQEVYINGEESKDFSVFINHSWDAANVELMKKVTSTSQGISRWPQRLSRWSC